MSKERLLEQLKNSPQFLLLVFQEAVNKKNIVDDKKIVELLKIILDNSINVLKIQPKLELATEYVLAILKTKEFNEELHDGMVNGYIDSDEYIGLAALAKVDIQRAIECYNTICNKEKIKHN